MVCAESVLITAPGSSLFSATLDADPINAAYCSPSNCCCGVPPSSCSTAADWSDVSISPFNGQPGPQFSGDIPKLSTPMLENPVSSRCVYSYDPKKNVLSFLIGPPIVIPVWIRVYGCFTGTRSPDRGSICPENGLRAWNDLFLP